MQSDDSDLNDTFFTFWQKEASLAPVPQQSVNGIKGGLYHLGVSRITDEEGGTFSTSLAKATLADK